MTANQRGCPVVVDTERPGALDVEGEGAERLRRGEPNLVQRAMEKFAEATGRQY